MRLSQNSKNITSKTCFLVATLSLSLFSGCYQTTQSNNDVNDSYHTPMQQHGSNDNSYRNSSNPNEHHNIHHSSDMHTHATGQHDSAAYQPHDSSANSDLASNNVTRNNVTTNNVTSNGTTNHSNISADNLASGHYSRTIRLSTSDNQISDNPSFNQSATDSEITVTVHVAQISLLKPAKQISLSVSSKPSKIANLDVDSLGGEPACEFRGTASLMGQDALHGVIYTFPVDNLALHQRDNLTSSNSAVNVNNATFTANNNSGLVFLRFKDNTLTIDSNHANALDSICRGNLSLKGDYSKLN